MATIRDCTRIQPLLSEYVDGTLTDQVSWDVKMHITSCAVCAKIADDFSATSRLLGELPQMELSANFEAMLTQRLADEALRPRQRTPWNRFTDTLSEIWQNSTRRNVMATGVAVAAMVPLVVVILNMNRPLPNTNVRQVATTTVPTPAAIKSTGNDTSPLDPDKMWNGHLSAAASEVLGDPSGLLAVRGEGM